MHINKIDDVIDKTIDDFYAKILTDQKLSKIFDDVNFVKYQKELNDLMMSFIKQIDENEIKDIVKKNDSFSHIYETIKRYIAFYLFLTIGFNYKGKDDTFINNVVEFSKNQSEYNYRISKFFNSESNSQVIKYFTMIKQILNILEADNQKKEMLMKRPDYKETFDLLNVLGTEFIDSQFKIKDKRSQCHNIIKTLIVLLLYKINERKDFFKFLEMAESMEGEYIFIEIVVPSKNVIDFEAVESVLNKNDIIRGYADLYWEYLQEGVKIKSLSIEDKILKLINAKVLIPIVDDFLLYHRDNERYDKNNKAKKKEDTKIRFIVNKIDLASDLYSANNTEAKKQFYVPMYNRKAVIVNDVEDIKIINKFINQGKRSNENSELLNDLVQHRLYPYCNFKDNKNAMQMVLNKTVDIVRSVSLEKKDEFRQSKNSYLQMRIGSDEMQVNIIGFMIPTNLTAIQCIKTGNVIDIRNVTEIKNGITLAHGFLQKSFIEKIDHKSSVYWFFDTDTDEVILDTYEQTKQTKSEQIKLIIGKLHDDIIDSIYNNILSELEKKKDLTLQNANMIIDRIEKKTLKITDDDNVKFKLENDIYTAFIENITPEYDVEDDILRGFTGDIEKLPVIDRTTTDDFVTFDIKLAQLDEKGQYIEEEKIIGVCQHNIDWDELNDTRISNPKKYVDDLHKFVQTYVVENIERDYVCKSCGFHVNIKKYVADAMFDDETQKMITYSMPMETPLEDIEEYAKYRKLIGFIDKQIDRLSLISNIAYFTGILPTTKWRRKAIVKDTIDLILVNNAFLRKNLKERNEMASKLYGINRDLSKLFSFELDNNIFTFSSQDKDFYKPIKQNNILSYVIFLIMLELNDSQISYITGDKKGFCNFAVFDKVYSTLFEGLKLRKNNKGDVIPVKNYKIFCYVLYMLSCMITKYSMWQYDFKDAKDPASRKKYMPIIQKSIIHTVIDIINSVMENANESTDRIYEVIQSKFYNRLATTFSNENTYTKFKEDVIESLRSDRKEFILTKPTAIELTGNYKYVFDAPEHWRFCRPAKYYMPNLPPVDYEKHYEKTNLTNCESGSFHKWVPKGKFFVCENCSVNMEIKYDKKMSDVIKENYKYNIKLSDYAKIYCLDGTRHNFYIDQKTQKNMCSKCGNDENQEYNKKDLDKLEENVNKNMEIKTENVNKIMDENESIRKHANDYYSKIKNKIVKKYNSSISKDDKYKFISEFVRKMADILSNDAGSDVFFKDNAYVINHDYMGNSLSKPIIITDKDNKITYKKNHPFFKTDVIYYTSYKNGKIDVFYDATKKILLGYKEESKNFIEQRKPNRKIIINYSIQNKLKYLGYVSQYIDADKYDYSIEDIKLKDQTTSSSDSKTQSKKNEDIIKYIIRERMTNLKDVMYKFQRVIMRILNSSQKIEKEKDKEKMFDKDNYENDNDEQTYFSAKYDNIVEKYRKKINNISLDDNNGNHPIFKHWKGVQRAFYTDDLSEYNIETSNDPILEADYINDINVNGNMILFYIVQELQKLIDYNDSKSSKIHICQFYLDFINLIFDVYNQETLATNQDIKRFSYILNSFTFIQEIADIIGEQTAGIYDEYVDPNDVVDDETKEALEDDEEEANALDMDMDVEYESNYDKSLDYEPVLRETYSEGMYGGG